MKIKLFILAIFVLLSFVAYQKYSEYFSLKSIDSYEACITAKGSVIQESYPATCVTRLGSRFIQPIPSLNLTPSPEIIKNPQISNFVIDNIYAWNLINNEAGTTYIKEDSCVDSEFGISGCNYIEISYSSDSSENKSIFDTNKVNTQFNNKYPAIKINLISTCSPKPPTTCYRFVRNTYYLQDPINYNYLWTITQNISNEVATYNKIGLKGEAESDQILSTFKFTD